MTRDFSSIGLEWYLNEINLRWKISFTRQKYERIKEGFLRQLFKTTKGCPISQRYLEVGQVPARFEITKMRLLFLQYILKQSQESMIQKFLFLQFQQPTKGDWGSACLGDLKDLNISNTLEEIKTMTKQKFKKIIKEKLK